MYNEIDMAELSEVGQKIASYKCFQKQFANSCQGYVKEEIYNFYKAKMSQEPAADATLTVADTTTTAADTTTTAADTTKPTVPWPPTPPEQRFKELQKLFLFLI